MTKIHEEIFRGNLRDFQLFKDSIKGELTVIISENELKTKELDSSKIKPKIKKYLKKYSLKDTVDLIFETEGVSKKEIYKLCLKEKNEKNY